jgi:hypothetical protein
MKRYQAITRFCAFAVVCGLAFTAGGQTVKNASASVEDLQSSIKRDPRNPKLYVALGLAYWDRNDYPHAFAAFRLRRTTGWESRFWKRPTCQTRFPNSERPWRLIPDMRALTPTWDPPWLRAAT